MREADAASSLTPDVAIPDSLRGLSGQLKLAILPPAPDTLPTASVGLAASPPIPAVWTVADSARRDVFHFITLLPFGEKQNGRVGAFRVGRWPAERRASRSGLPTGFIEVTQEMQSLQVSTHFTLGDFISLRDQPEVWPRPLVLDLRLVDKLELLLTALEDSGVVAPRLKLLSAFRTPNVTMRNARTAQAPDSRHQYGDAADFIVDANGDGAMDDLTGDRRVDLADARYLVRLVLAIEEAHPTLLGGIGVYRSTAGSGPFVHVDARGERARWGLQ